MNAKKIKTVLLAALLAAGGFFNVFAENKNTRYVIKTLYFDVIYKSPSRATANLIAENVDQIYLDLRSSFQIEEYFHFKHFPIYIEYSEDELNAMYTDYPFRQIVFYDTAPTSTLINFDNNILSVLKHELAHAVSLNIKNKMNEVISEIIFDGWGNSFYTSPTTVLEGMAVQKESEGGLGRLNDPFSTFMIKQSAIENVFPEYQETTGARDIYPSGTVPYIFGGAFTDFVIKKYGKERFKEFAARINDDLKNYKWIYRKVYSAEIWDDWNEFYKQFSDSTDALGVTVNPYDTEGVFDFYSVLDGDRTADNRAGNHAEKNVQQSLDQQNRAQKNRGVKQKALSRPSKTTSFITKEKSGTAWLFEDNGEVWYTERAGISNGEGTSNDASARNLCRPNKLFTMLGVSKISFSSDGRYLTVSRTLQYASSTNKVCIYDMKKKTFINFDENGCRDAQVVYTEGKYYLALVKTESQYSFLQIWQINDKTNRLDSPSKFIPFSVLPFEHGDFAFNLSDAGGGFLGYLSKHGTSYAVNLYSFKNLQHYVIDVPSDIYIRDFNACSSGNFITGQKGLLFAFSYAKKETLPRLGFMSVRLSEEGLYDAKFHLMLQDLSGGIFSPSVYVASQSQRLPSIVYSSHFYTHSKLSVIDTDNFDFEKHEAVVIKLPSTADEGFVQEQLETPPEEYRAQKDKVLDKRFNPFEYTFRGIFVPVGLVPIYNEQFMIQDAAFLGITWHSKGYHFSCGYEPITNLAGLHLVLFDSTPNKNFSYRLWGTAIFDRNGFRQTEDELSLTAKIPVLTHSNIVLENTEKFFYGKPNKFPWMPGAASSDKTILFFSSVSSALLSSLRKTGAEYHAKGGIYAGPVISYNYINSSDPTENGYGLNLGFRAGFSVPNILPFENPVGYTFNLPTQADFQLFPNIDRFMSCSASVVLFSHEVQKGTKNAFIPLYLNRFYFTASYEGNLYYKEYVNMAVSKPDKIPGYLAQSKYADSIGLGMVWDLTINTGSFFEKLGALKLSCDVLYDINQKDAGKGRFHLKVLSQLVF